MENVESAKSFDVKALKLSETMIKAIELGQYGNTIIGNSNTMAALVGRGLIGPGRSEHVLTELGHQAYEAITGRTDSRDRLLNAAAEIHYANATSEDGGRSFYTSETYRASARAVTEIAERMFPGIEHETVHALLADSSGDSLARMIRDHLADRALCAAQDAAELASEDHRAEPDMITDARDARINAREAVIEADNARLAAEWDDVSVGEEHYESLNLETNELPGDIERAWDAENAAAERRDIESEYEAEAEAEKAEVDAIEAARIAAYDAKLIDGLVSDLLSDDRLMWLTPKGVFVSNNYVNTMRRIGEVARVNASGFELRRQHMIDDAPNLFALIDDVFSQGKITFGEADREKRRIRAFCRPSLGSKRKPSGKRRSRR